MGRNRLPTSVIPTTTPTHTPKAAPNGSLKGISATPATAAEVLQLQRLYGNRAVTRYLAPATPAIQRKDKTHADAARVVTPFYVKLLATELLSSTYQKILVQLGGGRKFGRRGKTGTETREALKGAAREQAAEDIKVGVHSNADLQGSSEAKKDYVGMKAQAKAYSAAKDSTQSDIEFTAADILIEALSLDALTALTRQKVLDAFPNGGERFRLDQAATEFLKDYIAQTKGSIEAHAFAKTAALQQDIVGGQANPLTTDVKKSVTDLGIGARSVEKAIESPNINLFFRAIARIIDMEVPNVGDKCKITVSGKVWIPKTPAYVMVTLISDIKRDKLIKVRGEAMIGVGAGEKLWDLNVQAGVYTEVNGEDSIKAMELFSYGVFRGLKSKGLKKFPNYAWSEAGETIKVDAAGKAAGKLTREEEAETWAAMVEENALSSDDAYAEVGWLAKAKATGGDDKLAKGEAEGMFATGRRYSKKTLGKDSAGANLAGKANKSRAELKQANKGESRRVLQGQVKLSSDWFGQAGAKIKATWMYDRAKEKYDWRELEVEIEGHLGGVAKNIATGSEEKILAMVFAGIQAFFIPGEAIHRFVATDGSVKEDGSVVAGKSSSKGKTDTEDRSRTAGNALHLGTDVVPLIAVGANAIAEGAAKTIFGGIVGQRNHIGVNFKYVAKKADPKWAKTWELSFFLGKLTKIKVGEVLTGEFKTDIETSHRLFMLKSDGSRQFS